MKRRRFGEEAISLIEDIEAWNGNLGENGPSYGGV